MTKGNFLSVLFVAVLVFLVAMRGGDKKADLPEVADEVRDTSLSFMIAEAPLASILSSFETNTPIVFAKYLWKGDDLVAKNINQRWAMASLTKLMTAVVAEENINFDRSISMSASALTAEGTAGGFLPGEIFTAKDLMKAMLVVSSNDAAEALAESYGRKDFLESMRRKAEELGMSNTYYDDVTGLSSLNQSTAADLERLVRYIYSEHPNIFETSRLREVEIFELKSRIRRRLNNINKFAGEDNFLGGKTGFTEEAGGNLISIFRYDNQPLLIIVFGAEDRFAETQKVFNWIKQ